MSKILKRGKIWYIDFFYKGKRIRQSLKTRSKRVARLIILKVPSIGLARGWNMAQIWHKRQKWP